VKARAVVTGANGFVGRNLVAYLVGGGWSVRAVDKVPCEGIAVESVVLDVRTPGGLLPLLDAETTLFHLAACADIRFSVQHPRDDFDNNVRGLFEALEAARQRGSRMLFASTASVFNASNPLPWAETGLPRPRSPYAAGRVSGGAALWNAIYGFPARRCACPRA
jgi:nucleoside-diphosphate-sugar epimerase